MGRKSSKRSQAAWQGPGFDTVGLTILPGVSLPAWAEPPEAGSADPGDSEDAEMTPSAGATAAAGPGPSARPATEQDWAAAAATMAQEAAGATPSPGPRPTEHMPGDGGPRVPAMAAAAMDSGLAPGTATVGSPDSLAATASSPFTFTDAAGPGPIAGPAPAAAPDGLAHDGLVGFDSRTSPGMGAGMGPGREPGMSPGLDLAPPPPLLPPPPRPGSTQTWGLGHEPAAGALWPPAAEPAATGAARPETGSAGPTADQVALLAHAVSVPAQGRTVGGQAVMDPTVGHRAGLACAAEVARGEPVPGIAVSLEPKPSGRTPAEPEPSEPMSGDPASREPVSSETRPGNQSTSEPERPAVDRAAPDQPQLSPEHVALLTWWAQLIEAGQIPAPTGADDTAAEPTESRRQFPTKAAVVTLAALAAVGLAAFVGPRLLAESADPVAVPAADVVLPPTVGDLVAVTAADAGEDVEAALGFGIRPAGVTVTGAYGVQAQGPLSFAVMATSIAAPTDAGGQITAWAERTGSTVGEPIVGEGATVGVTCATASDSPTLAAGSFCVWASPSARGQTYAIDTPTDDAASLTAQLRATTTTTTALG